MSPAQFKRAFNAAMDESCFQWHVSHQQIIGRYRNQNEASARHCVAYALRCLGASYSVIGTMLGGRDHGTALHSTLQANRIMDVDTRFMRSAMAVREAARQAHEQPDHDAAASAVILGEAK